MGAEEGAREGPPRARGRPARTHREAEATVQGIWQRRDADGNAPHPRESAAAWRWVLELASCVTTSPPATARAGAAGSDRSPAPPTSPEFEDLVMEAAVQAGMPVLLLSAGQAGATSPATLARCVVQSVAEVLAGLVYVLVYFLLL